MRWSQCMMAGGKRQEDGVRWRGELQGSWYWSCPVGLQIWEGTLFVYPQWFNYPPCESALCFGLSSSEAQVSPTPKVSLGKVLIESGCEGTEEVPVPWRAACTLLQQDGVVLPGRQPRRTPGLP